MLMLIPEVRRTLYSNLLSFTEMAFAACIFSALSFFMVLVPFSLLLAFACIKKTKQRNYSKGT